MPNRNWEEQITITMNRTEWFNVTNALGHDCFDGAFNDEYNKIWAAAFPEEND
jgi:hypothetical protein